MRNVPYARTSIILALDVSRSMCSTDVEPNRLAVAQEAARAFVENQPKGVRMGLVVFSGFAELTVPPTTDRKALVDAIDGLTTGRGTAIGSAMLKGLDAIAEVNPDVPPVGDAPETGAARRRRSPGAERLRARHRRAPHRRREQPRDRAARRRAVRGRAARSRLHDRLRDDEPRAARPARASSSAATSSTPAGSGRRRRRRVRRWRVRRVRAASSVADVPTLKAVAKQTGGTYHGAKDADQLRKVFADLPKEVATQKQPTEITWIFAALGALLAGGGGRGVDALEPVPVADASLSEGRWRRASTSYSDRRSGRCLPRGGFHWFRGEELPLTGYPAQRFTPATVKHDS